MKKTFVRILCLAISLLTLSALVSCGDGSENTSSEESTVIYNSKVDFTKEGNTISMNDYETTNPVVALKIKDYGVIVIELYPEVAPNTVNNFISLVSKGFYDNNSIHRMVPGFMVQGGDPDGAGTGGPGYSIKGEFSSNGVANNLLHTRGVISMARSKDADSAGSQFFIMFDTAPHLDGEYAAFGKVLEGYEVLDEIEKIPYYNLYTGKLGTNLVIEKAVVDTKGKTYPEPEKIN